MNKIKIQTFEEKDAKEASNLIRRAITEVNSEVYPSEIIKNLYDHFSPEILIEIGKKGDLILAIEKGKILGTARLTKNRIQTIFVDPDRHRQGIGTQLMIAIENLAIEKGLRSITLGAAINAVGFYEKLGYKDTKEQFEDELGLVYIMKKEL